MSHDAPESAQHAVSLLLYISILLVFARVIAWDTEWMAVYIKQAEAVLSDCACFIVAIIFLSLILRCFLSTLGGVIASFKGVFTKMYVLLGF